MQKWRLLPEHGFPMAHPLQVHFGHFHFVQFTRFRCLVFLIPFSLPSTLNNFAFLSIFSLIYSYKLLSFPPDEDFLSETRLHHPHIHAGTTISISAIDAFSFDDVISAQVATPGHFFPHFRAAHSAFYGLITALRYQSVFYSFIPHFALRRSKTVR